MWPILLILLCNGLKLAYKSKESNYSTSILKACDNFELSCLEQCLGTLRDARFYLLLCFPNSAKPPNDLREKKIHLQ